MCPLHLSPPAPRHCRKPHLAHDKGVPTPPLPPPPPLPHLTPPPTNRSNGLSRSKPLPRVMSPPLMLSTLLQLAVVVVFQLASLALLRAQVGAVDVCV